MTQTTLKKHVYFVQLNDRPFLHHRPSPNHPAGQEPDNAAAAAAVADDEVQLSAEPF